MGNEQIRSLSVEQLSKIDLEILRKALSENQVRTLSIEQLSKFNPEILRKALDLAEKKR